MLDKVTLLVSCLRFQGGKQRFRMILSFCEASRNTPMIPVSSFNSKIHPPPEAPGSLFCILLRSPSPSPASRKPRVRPTLPPFASSVSHREVLSAELSSGTTPRTNSESHNRVVVDATEDIALLREVSRRENLVVVVAKQGRRQPGLVGEKAPPCKERDTRRKPPSF